MIAKGTFEVKIVPLPTDVHSDMPTLGRLSLDKTFSGDLQATSKGQMLTGMTDVKDSAVYVAIEKVSGALQEKTGSFILHHRGIMNRGEQILEVLIVPDSGTEEFKGISGTMKIIIDGKKHLYELEYLLV